MATTIRLTRMGKKKRPFYRLVVLDSRKRRDGAYLANLGYYNPFVDPFDLKLNEDEILGWLRKGATVSDTARSLLRQEGILYRWSLERGGMEAAEIETKMNEWRAGAEAKAARAELKKVEAAKAVEAKAAAEAAAEKAAEEEAAAKAAAEEAAAAKAAADEKAAAEAEAEAEAAAEKAAAEAEAAPEEASEEAPAEAPAEAKDDAAEKPAEEG